MLRRRYAFYKFSQVLGNGEQIELGAACVGYYLETQLTYIVLAA